MRSHYKRSGRRYPYRSHLQWLRAAYGLLFCTVFIVFQGWRTLISPVSGNDFVAAYISVSYNTPLSTRKSSSELTRACLSHPQVPVFVALSVAYFLSTRGFNPSKWHVRAIGFTGLEAIGPIVVADPNSRDPCKVCHQRHRRGVLVLPKEKGAAPQKAKAVLEWIWAWLK